MNGKHLISLISMALILALLAGMVHARTNAPLSVQREQYLAARTALAQGRIQEFERLAEKLRDYPLYPYLQYEKLQRRMRHAAESEIRDFLDQYGFIPVAYRLRGEWLDSLKRRGQTRKYLQYYDDRSSAKYKCYAVYARTLHGPVEGLEDEALNLWLVGESQPSECDPVFAWLEKRNLLSNDVRWQRIGLAMERRKLTLARYLSKKLPDADQPFFTAWLEVDRDPSALARLDILQEDKPIVRRIVGHAIGRIARGRVTDAMAKWQSLQQQYQFTEQEITSVDAQIALTAAQRHHPLASDLMQLLPDNIEDNKVQQWRARAALRAGDWPAVLRSVVLMDTDTRAELEWRYWHARALEKLGIENDAQQIYQEVAQERDYYGFLAADRMHTPYQLRNQPLSFVDAKIGTLLEMPEFLRIRELYHVGQIYDAQREWNRLPGILDNEQLAVAAYIAHQWDWHFNAIMTIAKSGYYDDLSVRFPTPYDTIVNQASRQFKIDSAWIYGVIRQESAFNVGARSHAGASGLMQLMPATAKQVARSINQSNPSRSKLLQPELNVQLGSAYLQQMLQRYNNHQVLATASYNAGPHRVKRWLPDTDQPMAADIWVDTIPFNETRSYVRRVLSYTTVYEWKLSNNMTRLEQRMPPVQGR